VVADLGAPCFDADDPDFLQEVECWIGSGACAPWDAAGGAFVGVPTMDAIVDHMAQGIDVRSGCRVDRIVRHDGAWAVEFERRDDARLTERSDRIVLATHPRDAARLIGDYSNQLSSMLGSVETLCVWVLMMRINDPLEGFPAMVEVSDKIIARIIRDNHKPGRCCDTDSSMLVIHAREDWSAANRELDRDEAQRVLIEHTRSLVSSMFGHDVKDQLIGDVQVHRWGSAHPVKGLPQLCGTDDDARVVVCGDAFGWKGLSLGVQSAWLSGRAAALTLIESTD
jgi:renalase